MCSMVLGYLSRFGFNMTYESARAASCSTCTAKDDLSNYWVPYLYYQEKDGSFTPVSMFRDVAGPFASSLLTSSLLTG